MENIDYNQQNKIEVQEGGDAFKKPSVRAVCILFSVSVILLMFLASRAQRGDFYSGILITEFILVLIPPLILLFWGRYDVKKVLRLNKVRPVNLLLVLGLMLFSIPLANMLNVMYLALVKVIFGQVVTTSIAPPTSGLTLFINVLVIGGSAGICEEVLFRGTIQRGMERLGAIKAVFITAFLFGLWHLYFTSLFGTFILGALIGFIVYRTNSLYSGMFAHFTNNSAVVVIGYLADKFGKSIPKQGQAGASVNADEAVNSIISMISNQPLAFIFVMLFWIFFFGTIVTVLLIIFFRTTANTLDRGVTERNKKSGTQLLWLLPGLSFISFMYFALGLKLSGIKLEWVSNVLKIISGG